MTADSELGIDLALGKFKNSGKPGESSDLGPSMYP